jgi:hypothetical protein
MKKILLVLSLVCAFCSAASAQTTLVVQSVNGALNAARYCTTPGTLDQTCIQNAAAAATGVEWIHSKQPWPKKAKARLKEEIIDAQTGSVGLKVHDVDLGHEQQ